MTNSNIKSKDSKVVACNTDDHGNIVIDINTKVVLGEKFAEAGNINSKRSTLQEERHAASKLNHDFASKAESGGVNTGSKEEATESKHTNPIYLKDSEGVNALTNDSNYFGDNMTKHEGAEEVVVPTVLIGRDEEEKGGMVGFLTEHPLLAFWFGVSFLILDIILLAICFFGLPHMPRFCELPVISLICMFIGCVIKCLDK